MDTGQRARRAVALVSMSVILGVVTGLLSILGTPLAALARLTRARQEGSRAPTRSRATHAFPPWPACRSRMRRTTATPMLPPAGSQSDA